MTAHPLRPLSGTKAMINFDMIGRNETESDQTKGLIEIPADTSNRLNLIGGTYSPEYRRIVEQENLNVGLVLDDRFDHESALNVFFRSDQFPFVLHDIPAFWWFTGFHPDYHHTTDTFDRINYVKMAKILRLAYLTAFRIGDAKETPKFIANPRG
jgi:Zn-dependent M28 family amino/carboxypeptidase